MVAVGYPWLRAVQQGGKYNGSIDADLSALFQMLVVSNSFVESAKTTVYLGQSVVYFPVNLGIWCHVTSQISELINCCGEGSSFQEVQTGKGPQSSLSWTWVRRAGLPLQSRELGAAELFQCGQWRQCHQRRRGHGTAAQVFLCGHAVTSEVKQTAIKMVVDVYSTISIKFFYDLFKHHAEKDAEQSQCQNTTQFHAVDNSINNSIKQFN